MKKEFTREEFHANPKAVIEAANEGTVTILGGDGKPRMFILKQLEPLDDDHEETTEENILLLLQKHKKSRLSDITKRTTEPYKAKKIILKLIDEGRVTVDYNYELNLEGRQRYKCRICGDYKDECGCTGYEG